MKPETTIVVTTDDQLILDMIQKSYGKTLEEALNLVSRMKADGSYAHVAAMARNFINEFRS